MIRSNTNRRGTPAPQRTGHHAGTPHTGRRDTSLALLPAGADTPLPGAVHGRHTVGAGSASADGVRPNRRPALPDFGDVLADRTDAPGGGPRTAAPATFEHGGAARSLARSDVRPGGVE